MTQATFDRNTQLSQERLQILQKALSHMKRGGDLFCDQSVSTPLSIALFRMAALSVFVLASRLVSKTAEAATEGRVQKALAKATEQGPSGGVDRISVHSNLSVLSNIMRLCAANLDNSSAVEAAAQTSEIIAGRSISVLWSHVSELAKALHQLANPQQDTSGISASASTNSSVDLAKPEALEQFKDVIKAVLDGIEEGNGQHVIPNLNRDMASQLNTSAHGAVASLVATHSMFSNPVTLSAKASKKAVHTNDAQKNEALMATLPSLTEMLNRIQASTRNFMEEIKKDIHPAASKDGGLLSTHDTVGSSTAAVYWAASAMALLADEMLSICRSLTLIDKNRSQASLKIASELQSRDQSAQASEQISWDSHLEQDYSATHAITALRLTLSHTGIALMQIAKNMHHALKDNTNTAQNNLAMHTLQRSLLDSCASAALHLAESTLFSTGAASAAPMSMLGSANWTHQKVHATDGHLHPAQTHNSENSSKNGSESCQATGFSTDLVAGTMTNILKVLAQGGLIGLNTILKLMKLLEIISLHRDSHIALKLESVDSSNPNGISINSIDEPSAGSVAGTSAILINFLGAFQTLDQSSGTQSTLNAQRNLQDIIDKQIAAIEVLKDDEERQETKGLKAFYKVIIRLLAPDASEENCDSLVKRLDFGGISLSSYHSSFGAYNDCPVPDLSFVAQFANQDDAQGLLRKFINKAKNDFSLFKSLHEQLPQAQRSTKAQTLYTHVYEELYQHYKQIKMMDIARHSSRKRVPTHEEFLSDLGLVQAPPLADANDEDQNQAEAPGTIGLN